MSNTLEWLLEEDATNPGVRYLAHRDLLKCPSDDPELESARRAVMEHGQVPTILAAQDPQGFWEEPGPGYYPKYRGTVWSMIYLAQLGAVGDDPRVRAGGEYLLAHSLTSAGFFTLNGSASGNIQCLAGNLGAALLDFGFGEDERLLRAVELMARFVTGEGIAITGNRRVPLRYLKSGNCGPGFLCSANNRLPCAWGAVKVLRALARIPAALRSPAMRAALDATVDFLFTVDPATAAYPAGYSDKPSRSWFRFGFPVFYITDVLQTAEALTEAGFGGDPRLAATYDLILDKRDETGRWPMEYSYAGKTWSDAEPRGKPSKWVTLRALRVLEDAELAA
jgi:hypothetical protein